MKKLKSILHRLDRHLGSLENTLASHGDWAAEQVIVVCAVVVWLGAMFLLP